MAGITFEDIKPEIVEHPVKEEPIEFVEENQFNVHNEIPVITKERVWSCYQLEALPESEYLNEIPSDVESNANENIEADEEDLTNDNFYADREQLEENGVIRLEDTEHLTSDNKVDWSDEDDIPMCFVRNTLRQNKFDWTNDNSWKEPNPFVSETGPNISDTAKTPVEVFLQIFPLSILEHIVFQTNLYATQKHNANTNEFLHITLEEMKIFFAINILMGIKKLPYYKDYWSSNSELRDTYISSLMSCKRFQWILANIHLNDNTMQPAKGTLNYDKLYKIRPLLQTLEKTFKECYHPHENQSIDESMITFIGRSSSKQYIHQKLIKRGYKVWLRGDETGYICEFQIYTGKIANVTEKNLGDRVVKDLTRNLVGKYHRVYFDNYFNSASLQRDLYQDGIYACGSLKKGSKNIPKDFKSDQGMKRGDYNWKMTSDGLVTINWMDKKAVLFASNFHDPESGSVVKRRKKDGEEEIICPSIVSDYNMNIGFVDKADMLKRVYEIDRKSDKWYHRILWYFVDTSIINSFIIFKNHLEENATSLKSFRLSIVSGLVGAGYDRAARIKSKSLVPVMPFKKYVPYEKRFDQAAHLPVRATSLRCARCSTAAEPHRTKWKCNTCEVGLCLTDKRNCFILYHSK